MKSNTIIRFSASVLVLAILSNFVSAQTNYYWDSNGTTAGAGATTTGTWGTSNFWNTDSTGGGAGSFTSTTTSADNLYFVAGPSATSGNSNTTVTVSGTQVANSLNFQHAGAYTLSGGTSITLGNGTAGSGGITLAQNAYGSTTQGAVTINTNLILNNSQTWTTNVPNPAAGSTVGLLLINGSISGSSALSVNGPGRISITQSNTGFSGNILVSGGGELEARFNVTNTTGSFGTGNVEVNGGVVGLYFNNSLTRALGSGAGEIRITGGVSGFSGNGSSNTITITNGGNPLQWGSANFTPTEFVLQRSTANINASATFASAIDLNGDAGTPDGNGVVWRTIRSDQTGGLISGAAGSGTFSGNITNSGTTNQAGLIKTGAGHHILTATNTYNGGTRVNEGVLTATSTAALPGWNSSGKISVASGATIGVRGWASADIDTLRGNVTWASTSSALGIEVASGSFTYASNVSGAHSILKYGAGTLNLDGDLTGLGGTIILANGTLARTSGNLVTTNIEAQSGTISANIGGTTAVSKTTTGSVTLSGTNTYSGGFTMNAGTLVIPAGNYAGFGSGVVTINGGTWSFSSGSPSVVFENDITWNAVLSANRTASGTPTLTFNGDITLGASAGVSNAGATLSHAYIFNGNIGESGGSRSFTSSTGTAAGNSLTFNGQNTFTGNITSTTNGAVIIGGSGYLGGGNYAGNIAMAGGAFTYSSSANQKISGNITASTITKNTSADSTLVLSGSNIVTSATTVSNGTLQFATQASLYNSTTGSWTAANLRVASGATLAFNVGGTNEFTTGNVTTLLTNLAASTGATNGMNAGSNLGFDTTNASGGTFTIADVIANTTGASGGSRGLTKLGTGTLVLTNTNTYTGATAVAAGTLSLTGAGSVSNSTSIRVNSSATLDVSGLAGNFTVASGQTLSGGGAVLATGKTVTVNGTLAAGNSIESLTITASDLTLSGTSTFAYEMNNNVALAVAGDLTAVSGNLNLGDGALLTLSELGSGSWGVGEKLTLLSYTGTLTGLFTYNSATLNDDSTFEFSGATWQFNYNDTVAGSNYTSDLVGSNYITMTVIPEPKAALLGALGALLLLRRRR